jgi:hypothetical protein
MSERKERKIKDFAGWVSGRLTVLSLVERTEVGTKWLCQCSCGNKCVVLRSHLKERSTKSCGCLPRGWGGNRRSKAAFDAGQKRASASSKRRMTLEDAFARDPLSLLDRFRMESNLA